MPADRPFTCSVFIGTSLDGFIAREDGDLAWLTSRGEAAGGDLGYQKFADGIDTVVMGRGTYESGLAFDTWPHEGKHVAVLSTTLPDGADPRITVHRDLDRLLRALAERGATSVYVDGGQVIRAFLRAGLIDEMTITTVPVLLGTGLPLFGPVGGDVPLTHRSTQVFGAGVVQSTYTVERATSP
ncbi:dihydrofolate reductase family protein [Nonomuraea jiangxiensis]|uniref:Dihydrofolate reductase n=1 Tax=Nonomuraea jiangxiensis TaxID=633440 RepID=A0A1G8JTJ7_9ACTN|nr:dihydrofolate reductase family protein [Nonomuraea jiangxiensis]SDI34536.1 Dihydrofolate reductase [Nonomuraea jiangxiensis]